MKIEPTNIILFDMDGVLINTKTAVEKFWQQISDAYGISLTSDDFDHFIIGCTAKRSIKHILPNLDNSEVSGILEKLEQYEIEQNYTEVPGAINFIKSIKAQGFKVGLVTSAETFKVKEVCQQLNIGDLFDKIVTSRDITKGKPAPDCYLLAMQQFGKDNGECIIFEDSIIGVQSAVAAKAFCIGINPNRSLLSKYGAAMVFEDFNNQQLHGIFGIG